MTGMRSMARVRVINAGLTRVTAPTKPSSGSCASASIRCASVPARPNASGPKPLRAVTMSALTLPISTIWATSRVSASVTRRPSTNSLALPSLSNHSPICGPPPCTTTGRIPTRCISTMSDANCSNRSGSPMALPPNFTTTTAPRNASMYGRACSRTCTARSGSRRGSSPPLGAPLASGLTELSPRRRVPGSREARAPGSCTARPDPTRPCPGCRWRRWTRRSRSGRRSGR